MPDPAAAEVVFDGLAADFFSVWFRFHPDLACEAGMTTVGPPLPPQSDDDLAALAAWLESLVVALEEIDFAALDPVRRIDLELMFAAARVEHRELHLRDWRRRDPVRFLPTGEVYRLTLAPPRDLRGTLLRLLEAMPQYLRLAAAQLIPAAPLIAPEMVQAGIAEAEKGRCYLRELASSPWLRKHCHGWGQLELIADDACSALAGFADMLRAEVAPRAAGVLGCGADHLRFLLRHRHFIDCDPAALAPSLDRALDETDGLLGDLCASLGIATAEASRWLDAVAVDGRTRIESYHVECERLHAMLRDKGIVTLPRVPLHVCERPDCPRPQRLAADYVASWGDECNGTLFLASRDWTPIPDAGAELGGGSAPDALARVRGRCLSRTWGGAHLIAFAGGEAARRLPRRLASGSSLSGGWDLYLRERLAAGDGFGASAAERLHGLLHRRDLIQLARLHLALHSGQLGASEVGARLEAQGMDRDRLIRLARAPGDAIAAVLGWRMIWEARRLLERRQGAGFSERGFHDSLVGQGPIPLPLVLRYGLGVDLWHEVRGAVLG